MAKKVSVSLIDDINGKAADETVIFGFDGVSYEIELTTKNAEKLRGELTAWATAGRRLTEGPRYRSPAGLPGPRASIDHDESDAIREWGKLNGFPVSIRGPIAFHLVDEYRADLLDVEDGPVINAPLAIGPAPAIKKKQPRHNHR